MGVSGVCAGDASKRKVGILAGPLTHTSHDARHTVGRVRGSYGLVVSSENTPKCENTCNIEGPGPHCWLLAAWIRFRSGAVTRIKLLRICID